MTSLPDLKIPALLSSILGILVLISTVAGLAIPDFYHFADPGLRPGCYSQDWIALAALPVLAWAIRAALRGSLRGITLWSGLLGYYIYGYLVYSFAPLYTLLYPLYLAIAGLAVFATVMVLRHLDVAALGERLRPHLPARLVVLLFGATVLFLAPVWCLQMVEAIGQGKASPFTAIHVLDLGFVFPALTAVAVGLWKRRPWGYALAGPLLVLSVTMTFSLVVGEVLAFLRAAPDPLPLTITFSVIALASGLLTRSYLHELREAG